MKSASIISYLKDTLPLIGGVKLDNGLLPHQM